jgi:transmembrane sensor
MNAEQRISTTTSGIAREQAAYWHDRLQQDPVTDDTRAEFSRWLDASPSNRAAYGAVGRTWRLAQGAAHDPGILALRHEAALRLTRRPARLMWIAPWATAAAITALIGGTLAITQWSELTALYDHLRSANAPEYVTRVGERLTVTLEDGSQVTLNTDSVLRPAFDEAERRVVLVRGQALFEVAKDRRRPFVVETQNRRFVAVGTAFDVRVDGDKVQVTMLEGTVRVEQKQPPKAQAATAPSPASATTTRAPPAIATITAGEQLTVDATRLDCVQLADAERITSWRRGQVIFENSRLADAVAELNRYSTTQIALADRTLEELRISGAFASGRPAVFVEALTTYFPIAVTRVDDSTLLLSPREAPPP